METLRKYNEMALLTGLALILLSLKCRCRRSFFCPASRWDWPMW